MTQWHDGPATQPAQPAGAPGLDPAGAHLANANPGSAPGLDPAGAHLANPNPGSAPGLDPAGAHLANPNPGSAPGLDPAGAHLANPNPGSAPGLDPTAAPPTDEPPRGVNPFPVILGLLCLLTAGTVAGYELTGDTWDWGRWAIPIIVGVGSLLVIIGGIGLLTARRRSR